jgi:hypothetical protein
MNNGQSFESQFRASLVNTPAPVQPQPMRTSKPNRILAIVIIVATIVVAALVLVLLFVPKDGCAVKDFEVHAYDETDDEEVLSEEYKNAALKNEHAKYVTEKPGTAFVDYDPDILCYSLGLKSRNIRNPQSIEGAVEVGALNSYAMDYYLDEGYIIFMNVTYAGIGDENIVIYARSASHYLTFRQVTETEAYYSTRGEILNNVEGIPKFYVLKGEL